MSTLRATPAGSARKNLVPLLLLALATGPALAAGRDGAGAKVWATIRFPGTARVVFSPDSKLIALQRNDRVQVWDIPSRKQLWAEAGAGDPMADFAGEISLPVQFSPDGALLAIAEGYNPTAMYQRAAADAKNLRDPAAIMQAMNPTAGIQLRGARTGTIKARVGAESAPGYVRAGCAMQFAADGKTILLIHFVQDAGETLIETYDAVSGKRLAKAAAGGAYMLYNVAIAPDGKTLAAVVSKDTLQRMGGQVVGLRGGDGPLLLAVWDVPKVKQRALLPMPAKQTFGTPLLFSRDGKHVVTAGPAGVTLWDVQNGRLMRTLAPEAGKATAAWHGDSLSFPFLAWRPDGVTAVLSAGMSDAGLWLCDLRARTVKAVPGGGNGNARPGGIPSPNGTFALTVLRENIGLAPPKRGKAARNPAGANSKLRLEEEYILWDVASGSKLETLKPKETGDRSIPKLGDQHTIAFSPDESLVASSPGTGVVTLWNIAADRPVVPAAQDKQEVTSPPAE